MHSNTFSRLTDIFINQSVFEEPKMDSAKMGGGNNSLVPPYQFNLKKSLWRVEMAVIPWNFLISKCVPHLFFSSCADAPSHGGGVCCCCCDDGFSRDDALIWAFSASPLSSLFVVVVARSLAAMLEGPVVVVVFPPIHCHFPQQQQPPLIEGDTTAFF